MTELLVCPFCGVDDFDKYGLKYHLMFHCTIYPLVSAENPDGDLYKSKIWNTRAGEIG